jgi:amino acid adenylation domain-containing protein
MAQIEQVFQVPVIESYGMTEASHQMASNPLPPEKRKARSVGIAAGTQIAIMDDSGRTLGPCQTGEVVIRGPNVTRGYENNPEANKSAFTRGWFRTGDQGWLDSDGYLFITGRSKEIINRGGEKISPREVDEVLMEHPAVAQALAFALPDARLGEEVAAAVVLREGHAVDENELREFACARLADFKVPRRVLQLKEIPKGPTGKPQRIGLASQLGLTGSTQPDSHSAGGPATMVMPRTRTEELLCELWRAVLGLKQIGIHDTFLESGGDSILATQLVTRIREAIGADISLLRFFQLPTVALLAAWLDANEPASRVPLPSICRIPRDREIPLSFAQQRMWFLAQYSKDTAAYVRPAVFRLVGGLRVDALKESLNQIVARHETLRTNFHLQDGIPVQVISSPRPVEMPFADLSFTHESERSRLLRQLVAEAIRRPFDLSQDLMIRTRLVKLGQEEHLFLIVMHHICSDGWSSRVLLRELASLYLRGEDPSRTLPELPIQYSDFAAWQREWLTGPLLEQQLSYWQQRLAGTPPAISLPTDRPRPAVQSFRGATEFLDLPKELSAAVNALSRREGVTLFMTLLAAFQALLSRCTGSDDITVGSPVSNRTRVETEGLIGFFVNTLVLRADFSADPTFRQFLAQVRETTLSAYDHQDLPFEKLVDAMNPERSLSFSPLFQVMFQLRNVPLEIPNPEGLKIEALDVDAQVAQFDLTLEVSERSGTLHCLLNYCTDLFDATTIRRMLDHYRTLLQQVVDDPDRKISLLPILTEAELQQILVEWNRTEVDYPRDHCVHELFQNQAEKAPDAVAVVYEDEILTYGQLNRKSNQVANYLRRRGVGPDVLVGICMERSLQMVVALLGILKAGGAYVPLDPYYPKARLEFMLEDAATPLLLTQSHLIDKLPPTKAHIVPLDRDWAAIEEENPADPAIEVRTENLAYVIYTSGSTGTPKGVQVVHRGITRLLWGQNYATLDSSKVVLQSSTICFDFSTFELWGALLHGGRCVLLQERTPTVDALERVIARHGVDTAALTTQLFNMLMDEKPEVLRGIRQLLVGGEALSAAHIRLALTRLPEVAIVNGYGPTETTTLACCYRVPRAISESAVAIPIGPPIGNTEVYVLDRRLQPVPVGVTGELYIGGAGLARGYLNRPELTRERFIEHPFSTTPGARLYKTGDLVRWLPDGNLDFLGRIDDQVKIRGFRIELGEIESVLCRHPHVKQAAVTVREDRPGEKRLVAYPVLAKQPAIACQDLRSHLRQELPEYMIPSLFVPVEDLPLTPNGKVDRRALPLPGTARTGGAGDYTAPRNPVETALAKMWAELLHVERIGVHDDFFDLGGHSLTATRVVARIERQFGVSVPLQCIFETPTIAQLAELIVRDRTHGA